MLRGTSCSCPAKEERAELAGGTGLVRVRDVRVSSGLPCLPRTLSSPAPSSPAPYSLPIHPCILASTMNRLLAVNTWPVAEPCQWGCTLQGPEGVEVVAAQSALPSLPNSRLPFQPVNRLVLLRLMAGLQVPPESRGCFPQAHAHMLMLTSSCRGSGPEEHRTSTCLHAGPQSSPAIHCQLEEQDGTRMSQQEARAPKATPGRQGAAAQPAPTLVGGRGLGNSAGGVDRIRHVVTYAP